MKKIVLLTLIALIGMGFAQASKASIDDDKLAQLQAVIAESKLLPTPAGVGGNGARFGESVSIDGNRALIGSPTASEHGVAYIFDYDGTTWNETQHFFPDDVDANNRFGISVSLQGNRAVVGDKFNLVAGGFQAGAAYVYELNNGNWELSQKLVASDAGSVDKFGSSVSLAGDRILVGATDYDDVTNGSNSGAAYVFDYDGTNWQESAILTATGGSSGDGMGNAVSLDGDMALVGAKNFDDNNNTINTGSAYLFELNTGTWTQIKQFLASDGVDNDKYGVDVNLSNGRVLIGAEQTDEGFTDAGSAYVYEYDGLNWIETKLLAPDATSGERFGITVSIENNRLLVGTQNGEITGTNTGSAYLFDYDVNSSQWIFTQEIAADDITSNNFFASTLDLSGDKVIVGNFNDFDKGSQSGAAYVFDLNGAGTWQQSQKVVTQGAVEDNFGYSISLDGNRALIGAPLDDDNGLNRGAAYIFDYVNGQWSSPIKLVASDLSITNINFGSAVDLDGNNAIIAGNKINNVGTGKVYIFNFDGSNWSETAQLEGDIAGSTEYGFSVSIAGDRALVGAINENNPTAQVGSVYVYDKIANIWQLTDKLTPSDGQFSDTFGYSVSLFGDRALVGARQKNDTANSINGAGAAYIYDFDANTNLWIETKLQNPNPSHNGLFGGSVNLENDRAIIGAIGGRGQNNISTGTATIYDYDSASNTWNSTTLFAADGATQDNFGISVSLAGDRALIGAYQDDDGDTNSGAAYQFDFDGSNWIETKKHLASDGAKADLYGFSVSLSGDNALIGAYKDDDGGTDSGSVYTFNVEFIFGDNFE